jgi:XTP/dITP diphosphohydrolase
MNVVMSSTGGFVEVQGTGEHGTFDRTQLDALLSLAVAGIERLGALQAAALGEGGVTPDLLAARGERRVIVATRNPGKVAELRPLLEALGFVTVDLETAGIAASSGEDAVEAYGSFAENARAKARYYHVRAGGVPVVADDSGLEVRALGGAPGVHSRRYAGASGDAAAVDAANNAKLVAALAGVADRQARFVCAVCYVDAAGEVLVEAATTGRVLKRAVGERGFGYDALFLSDELGVSFGEAGREAKAEVSHRGRAMRALAAALAERAPGAPVDPVTERR